MASLICRRFRAALVDFAGGTLDAAEHERAARHVADCASCAGDLEALRAAPEHLAAAAPGPGEAFFRRQRQSILERIREAETRPRRPVRIIPRRPPAPFPWSAVFAAALATGIALVGWSRFERTFRPGIQVPAVVAPVPNDVDALDDATLLALAEVAGVIASPRFEAPGLEILTPRELDALEARLDRGTD